MEPERLNIWSLRTFCLITGSSRGLGQRMAVRFAQLLPKDSVIVLAARDSKGLATTKKYIEEVRDDIRVCISAMDLAEATETTLEDSLNTILTQLKSSPAEFQQAFLVHNAASMGDVSSLFSGHIDSEVLNRYWRLNLTHVVILNSVFWKKFDICSIRQKLVINITSICAKQAFKSWSIYCSGKAARDMMFLTMALEQPHILVLNYAPGPLDTAMQAVARTKTGDHELRTMFQNMHAEGRLLSCDQSIDRLVEILSTNRFHSGAHIDYYDDD